MKTNSEVCFTKQVSGSHPWVWFVQCWVSPIFAALQTPQMIILSLDETWGFFCCCLFLYISHLNFLTGFSKIRRKSHLLAAEILDIIRLGSILVMSHQ